MSSLAHFFGHTSWTILTFSWPCQLSQIDTKESMYGSNANHEILYLREGVGFGFAKIKRILVIVQTDF